MNTFFALVVVGALFMVCVFGLSWWLTSKAWMDNEKSASIFSAGLSSFVFMLMPVLVDGPIRNKYYERVDDYYFYIGPFIFFIAMLWISCFVGDE